MTPSEFIALRRRALGLTQKQLGLLCGYTGRSAESVPQNWEKGRQPVPVEKLRVLAAALRVPLDSPLIP